MDDCIFCLLANHAIPTQIVAEDEQFTAFKDANPQAPVHILVVPKKHYASIDDDVPADVMGGLLQMAVRVAKEQGIDKTGFRLIMNTGEDAGQTVKHLHCHVIGGMKMAEGMVSAAE